MPPTPPGRGRAIREPARSARSRSGPVRSLTLDGSVRPDDAPSEGALQHSLHGADAVQALPHGDDVRGVPMDRITEGLVLGRQRLLPVQGVADRVTLADTAERG